MTTERWEDVIPIWRDPGYADRTLAFDACVVRRPMAGAIVTCAEPVDWSGSGDARDLILSSWDACYGGRVLLFVRTGDNADGTPRLTYRGPVEGVSGFVTAIPDGGLFHLVSASRLRRTLLFYENVGQPGAPRFADPVEIKLDAAWLRDGEIFHLARFCDVDGDGRMELVLGTDYWRDYWPEGREWNVEGYLPYGPEGFWRGGPLRGNLYVFRNDGTLRAPRFGRGSPMTTTTGAVEVYGQLGPAFGDFSGTGGIDLICGSFIDVLCYFERHGEDFAPGRVLTTGNGHDLHLPHCIHIPTAVDWDRDGYLDLLVGAEDGRVWFLRNTGRTDDGLPVFDAPSQLTAEDAPARFGVLPIPAVTDWCGRGRGDVIAGNSTGEMLFASVTGGDKPAFGAIEPVAIGNRPLRVAAGPTGSLQGPSEYKFGYTSPAAAAWYGGPRPDIVMSDILGRYLVCRNLGGDPPRFAEAEELLCCGKPLRTVWRVRPAVTDWGMAGKLFLVTLDEDGVLSMFEKLSNTEVGNKRPLLYADGTHIRFTEDFGGGRGRIKLCACDWTGSGRIDILFGTHNRAALAPTGMPRHTTYEAGVFLLENRTSGAEPRFASAKTFSYRGRPLVFGMHECAPHPVWWRGGALPDLMVGVEDGSMVWFEREMLTW